MTIIIDGITAGHGRRQILHGIDWTVRPGVTGLLGPNGSGKTTLLSILARTLRPTEGSVTVLDAEARFGFLPQRFSIPGGMRLVDAISYTAWLNGVARDQRDSAARQALAAVDLSNEANARVKTLSGGQRQRAGIAAGIAHEPDVLFLDEPTAGLDAKQTRRVRDLITQIGRTRTVVLSTHLLGDVSSVCKHVGVLAHGRLVFDGTLAELQAAGEDHPPQALRSPVEAGYERLLATSGGTW